MDQILLETLAQWGAAGIIVFVAGYIIWNTHKEEKKIKEKYEEKLLQINGNSDTESTEKTKDAIKECINEPIRQINSKIDSVVRTQEEYNTKLDNINNKITDIESIVNGMVKDEPRHEADRLKKLASLAPAINTVLNSNMTKMRADHIFIALLHNGVQGITGIPFIKQTVVAEKFDPLKNINDKEYLIFFKDDELTKHDKLPTAILMDGLVDITVDEDGSSMMDDLDAIAAHHMSKTGTKRIMFNILRDSNSIPMGYVCAFSYTTRDMDIKVFKEAAKLIEHIYNGVGKKID